MKLVIGDHVMISVPEYQSIECGRAEVTNEDIGIIVGFHNRYIEVKWLTGAGQKWDTWHTTEEYLKKVEGFKDNRSALQMLMRY